MASHIATDKSVPPRIACGRGHNSPSGFPGSATQVNTNHEGLPTWTFRVVLSRPRMWFYVLTSRFLSEIELQRHQSHIDPDPGAPAFLESNSMSLKGTSSTSRTGPEGLCTSSSSSRRSRVPGCLAALRSHTSFGCQASTVCRS